MYYYQFPHPVYLAPVPVPTVSDVENDRHEPVSLPEETRNLEQPPQRQTNCPSLGFFICFMFLLLLWLVSGASKAGWKGGIVLWTHSYANRE